MFNFSKSYHTGSLVALSLGFQSLAFAAGSSKPNDASWDRNKSQPCSYACKEIPPDSAVLKTFARSTQATLRSSRFRILAWNLYKGREKNFRQEFLRVTKDADVILLSEVIDTDPVLPAMTALQGYGWNFATSFNMKDNVATGVAIGSKADAQSVAFTRTDDLEPFSKSPKATILETFKIPGTQDKLLVVSIHGINFKGDDGWERQLNQLMPYFRAHKGPIVFAGDFNTKNDNRVEIAKRILGEVGMTRVPWENPIKGKQLDDAFTRGLKVHSARLLMDVVGKGSDHPAIDLDLSY